MERQRREERLPYARMKTRRAREIERPHGRATQRLAHPTTQRLAHPTTQ